MITPREIIIVFWATAFGLFSWFIFSGARDWFDVTFPNSNAFFVGVIGILIILFIFKFRGNLPFRLPR